MSVWSQPSPGKFFVTSADLRPTGDPPECRRSVTGSRLKTAPERRGQKLSVRLSRVRVHACDGLCRRVDLYFWSPAEMFVGIRPLTIGCGKTFTLRSLLPRPLKL